MTSSTFLNLPLEKKKKILLSVVRAANAEQRKLMEKYKTKAKPEK